MDYYILTWTQDERPYRIDVNAPEATAVLLASALAGDATITEVNLRHEQVVSQDISEVVKAAPVAPAASKTRAKKAV